MPRVPRVPILTTLLLSLLYKEAALQERCCGQGEPLGAKEMNLLLLPPPKPHRAPPERWLPVPRGREATGLPAWHW